MSYSIATVSDDRYSLGTMVMLESLFSTTPEAKGSDVYILFDEESLSDRSKYLIQSIFEDRFNIKFVVSKKYHIVKKESWANFKKDYQENGWNFSVLLQAFLSDAIPENVDIVHYVDSDTIFTNNAVEFLNYLPKLPMAAQLDPGVGTQAENPIIPYFNAGVFIASLNYWRNFDILKTFSINNSSVFHAQNFLNNAFKNNWQVLGPQINVTREKLGLESEIKKLSFKNIENFIFHKTPTLVHYLGQPKPWEGDFFSGIGKNWRALGKTIWVDKHYVKILNTVKNLQKTIEGTRTGEP